VLHQFLYSHYNEKARWALAYKGVAHTRRSYLPGPHVPFIRRLSGQQQTPVLALDGQVISGSAAIIDELERRHPEPALYPADPALRERALGLQEHFDTQVGPATRTVVFSALIDEPDYLSRMFARDARPLGRRLYRASYPIARGLIARGNGVNDPTNVRRAFSTAREAFDRIAAQTQATGYLCGDEFSIADLTAAALLAPLVALAHPDMARPTPVPQRLAELYGEWEAHPAADWVRTQYARHRP
jgi:glutathione S-transferase